MAELNEWTLVRGNPSKPLEPRRVLEQLVRALRRQGEDDPEMSRWYLRRLASVFSVPFTLGDNNPVEHLRILAKTTTRVLEDAGADPSRRIEAAGIAVDLARVLGEVMTGWRDEAAGAPHSAVSGRTPP